MEGSSVSADRPVKPESHLRLTLILGMLSAFAPMSIDMYLPAFPTMAKELGVELGAVQLTLAAFLIGVSVGQSFYGPLADRFGRKRPLLIGCLIFVVACLGCAFGRSVEELIFWRVIMALGGAAGMVITRAVVRDLFDERESARMYSLLMLIMGVAPILAPLVGGQLLGHIGWRAIFGLLTIFGLVCAGSVWWGLPESLPIEKRSRQSWRQILPVYGHLLVDGRFLSYALACGFAAGVNFGYITGSPLVFMELHHVPPQYFGFFFGLNACGLIGGSQLNRRLLKTFPPERILASASILTASASSLLLISSATNLGGFPAQIILIFLCITSLGFIFPNAAAAGMAPFGRVAGSASALLGTVQFTIGSIAGALVGLLHNGTAIPMAAVVAGCGAGGFVALRFRLREPGGRPAEMRDSAGA